MELKARAGESAPDTAGVLLVIEDDEHIRSALKTGLELRGYLVDTASDGRQGLERLAVRQPALVVLDLMLPVLDGVGFVRELERLGLRPGIPIILLSADRDARERAIEVGAEGFLQKPLRLPALLQEIDRLLER